MGVTFKIKNIEKVEAYCIKHLGPQTYYLHTRKGGSGWMIILPFTNNAKLFIKDEKQGLFVFLALSEYLENEKAERRNLSSLA